MQSSVNFSVAQRICESRTESRIVGAARMNYPSSATSRTERANCNQSAMAGFVAGERSGVAGLGLLRGNISRSESVLSSDKAMTKLRDCLEVERVVDFGRVPIVE